LWIEFKGESVLRKASELLVSCITPGDIFWRDQTQSGQARHTWRIEALRRLEIPEEMQKKFGFKPLGPADGLVKRAILGEDDTRLYHFTPAQRSASENVRFVQLKESY
jgi:hypothetical protein